MTREEIDDLLKRREEAVARLETAKSKVRIKADSVSFLTGLPVEFRAFHVANLRTGVEEVVKAIDRLEAVIRETDPVFEEVAREIG